jgi:serine phosphatase RsbU (regulator of sigma subunit)
VNPRLITGQLLLFLLLVSGPLRSQNSKIQRLEDSLSRAAADTSRVNLMNNISYELQGIDPEKAMALAKEALALAEKISYRSGRAYSLTNIANIHSNRGDYEVSLDYYNRALQLRREGKDKEGVGKSLLGIGNIYLLLGNYNKAIDHYLQSLKICEELKNKHDIAFCLNNIGAVYYYQHNYEKALDHWKQTIRYYEEIGAKDEIISVLNNIGNVYGEQNEPKKALEVFVQAEQLSAQTGDKLTIAACHLNIGSVQVQLKNYDVALREFETAVSLYEELGDKENKALTLIYMGEVYRKQANYPRAVAILDTALAIAKDIRSRERVKLCYKELAFTYAASRDFEKAYQHFQYYSAEKDSLLNEESSKQITEMQTKYDTEKKEKENQILKQTVDIHELNANRQRIIIYSVCALAFTLVLLAFFIYRGYREKKGANTILSEKNKIIEAQHKDITDSIRYAQRIQQAILPPDKMWYGLLPDSFVLYKPKDILSGDFYWIEQRDEQVFFAAADCTGHGVPGALMSVVNFNLLNKAVLEQNIVTPQAILDAVNQWLTISLHQSFNESAVRDGMDIALCSLNLKTRTLHFAGAFNGAYVYRSDGTLLELNGDKMPVGAYIEEKMQHFSGSQLALGAGDRLFIFSDGYADQFGGPKGKKMKYTRLKQYISESLHMPVSGQKAHLEARFEEWRGNYEQVDDVLVIGVQV